MLARQENALLAALREHRDVRRLVRTVDTLPQVLGKDLLNRYATDAPALYVVPGRFRVQSDTITPQFTVACVARNMGGHDAARKGTDVDLGVDGLMALAVRALHGRRLGDCQWSLLAGEMVDDELFFNAGITALEMVFEGSPIELDADFAAHELADFLRLHGDMDLGGDAGHAVHEQWLQQPPDFSTSAPDAQLDVQLPGATT